jgi:Ser/Thr protein kinase RdoA (MazF antagonist)
MLGGVIADRIAEWGDADLPLERAVFGTADPEALAAAVDAWCVEHLGSGIARYHFFDSSSGSVHGVALTDGRDVVVKVHRPALPFAYLATMFHVQGALVEHGIPGPRPLVAPVPYGPAHVGAETMLPPVPRADGHDPAVRRAIAQGLADFVATGHLLGFERRTDFGHPMALDDPSHLYPEPHSPRFDFAATEAGAEWIDDLAARAHAARRALPAMPNVLAHGDWRIQNVEVADDRVVAIFDWDSVCVESEARAVATAARAFPVDWERPPGNYFPSDAEVAAFIAEYEDARGTPFTADERMHVAVELVAGLAYGARCEQSIHVADGADSQQDMLRRLGAPLLDHGLAALGIPPG